MEICLLFNLIRCENSFVYFKGSFFFVDLYFDGNYLSFKLISSALRSATCLLFDVSNVNKILMLRLELRVYKVFIMCVNCTIHFSLIFLYLGQIWCNDEICVGGKFVGIIYRIILMKIWMMRLSLS